MGRGRDRDREACARGLAVVVEPELHPFASYLWHLQGGGRMPAAPPLVLSPWAPEPWAGVDRPYLVATCHRHLYLDPLVSGAVTFGPVSARLRPFTQGRMLEAAVLASPPLPLRGFWPAEETPSGERFMWAAASAELGAAAAALGHRARSRARARARGRPAPGGGERPARALTGRSPRTWLWVGPDGLLRRDGPQRVRLDRARGYPAGGGDPRSWR